MIFQDTISLFFTIGLSKPNLFFFSHTNKMENIIFFNYMFTAPPINNPLEVDITICRTKNIPKICKILVLCSVRSAKINGS